MTQTKIEKTTKAIVEVDISFPLYRKYTLYSDYHPSDTTIYYRVLANGVGHTITEDRERRKGRQWEFETSDETSPGNLAYLLEACEASTEAEWNEVLKRFMDQLPAFASCQPAT